MAPRWLETVRDIDRRGAWDDRIVDALCDPPESFVLSSIVAHVLTHAAHRRQTVRGMLRDAGVLDEGTTAIRSTGCAQCPGGHRVKTIYYTATTLDGFIADEQDSLAWLFVQDQDMTGPLNYDEFIEGVGALVMGVDDLRVDARHRRG